MPCRHRQTIAASCAVVLASIAAVSAHVIRGLDAPQVATAFVSSPSAGTDAPILLQWGTQHTGLRVICFNAANTSPERSDRPGWPRITSVGFELPDSAAGFALLAPLDGSWELVEAVTASIPHQDPVTLDFAIVARVNPVGLSRGSDRDPSGIPPGQAGVRGSGTRFCVSGPFPPRLPDLTTADPDDTVATTIELLINGVVIGFHGVTGHHQGRDTGVWFPVPSVPDPRAIPLYR